MEPEENKYNINIQYIPNEIESAKMIRQHAMNSQPARDVPIVAYRLVRRPLGGIKMAKKPNMKNPQKSDQRKPAIPVTSYLVCIAKAPSAIQMEPVAPAASSTVLVSYWHEIAPPSMHGRAPQ